MYDYATTFSRFSFLRFDLEHTQDETLHLDCFCEVASGIEVIWLGINLYVKNSYTFNVDECSLDTTYM